MSDDITRVLVWSLVDLNVLIDSYETCKAVGKSDDIITIQIAIAQKLPVKSN